MNILVIFDYYAPQPLRQSYADHLLSFGKYSQHHVYYSNYSHGFPQYLEKVHFDLIIFHQGFAAAFRWCGLSYEQYTKRLEPLKKIPGKKVLFVQDEYFKMDHICRFINEYGIEVVFSVGEEREWNSMYREIDFSKVKIVENLTGYFDDDIVKTIESLQNEGIKRDIDIGYRAWHVPAWLGHFGKQKVEIAGVVEKEAKRQGMVTDISTVCDEKNIFHGLDWYRFMLRCKCFIGVEGGSSLMDYEGKIHLRVKAYLKANPNASFEEIEEACFKGMDGNLHLAALSPRHLEACATRTCQILIEGHYNGVLKPGVHYIALKKDYSNLGEALQLAQREDIREEITDRAFRDMVQSGLYTYSNFVKDTLEKCKGQREDAGSRAYPVHYQVNRMREWMVWKSMALEFYWFKKVKKLLPRSLITHLKTLRNRGDGV